MATASRHIVVLGAGLFGACTAIAAARAGFRVTLVDRCKAHEVGWAGMNALVARAHDAHPDAMALGWEGIAAWRQWREFVAPRFPTARFVESGLLLVTPAPGGEGAPAEIDRAWSLGEGGVDAIAARLGALGIPVERPDRSTILKKYSKLNIERDLDLLVEPAAGYVSEPQEAVLDARAACLALGVAARWERRVVGAELDGSGASPVLRAVRMATPTGGFEVLHADLTVNAAGAGAPGLADTLGTPAPLRTAPRLHLGVDADGLGDLAAGLPVVVDHALGLTLRPGARRVRLGGILAIDAGEFATDPDVAELPEAAAAVAERLARVSRRLVDVQLQDPRPRVAIHDIALADGRPLLGPTNVGGYLCAYGGGGVWLRAAPAVGELVCALAMRALDESSKPLGAPFAGRRTGLPIDPAAFSPLRCY